LVSSGDQFYNENKGQFRDKLVQYGVIAGEMESYGLFTKAHELGKKSLAMFTISDSRFVKNQDSSKQREQGYTAMMELALEIAPE